MAKGREVAGSEAGMSASSWMADEGEDMMTNIFYFIKGKAGYDTECGDCSRERVRTKKELPYFDNFILYIRKKTKIWKLLTFYEPCAMI